MLQALALMHAAANAKDKFHREDVELAVRGHKCVVDMVTANQTVEHYAATAQPVEYTADQGLR